MHVNDVDAFVTLVLWEDSRAALCPGLLCAEVEYSYEWNKGEPPSLRKDGNITVCKSGNNVPMVAGPKEPRIPDNPSKGVQNPGARSPGDRSHKVPKGLSTFVTRPLW